MGVTLKDSAAAGAGLGGVAMAMGGVGGGTTGGAAGAGGATAADGAAGAGAAGTAMAFACAGAEVDADNARSLEAMELTDAGAGTVTRCGGASDITGRKVMRCSELSFAEGVSS